MLPDLFWAQLSNIASCLYSTLQLITTRHQPVRSLRTYDKKAPPVEVPTEPIKFHENSENLSMDSPPVEVPLELKTTEMP